MLSISILSLGSLSALVVLLGPAFAVPLSRRQDATGPVITSDFPNPNIIKVNETWYAFGTQSIFDYRDIRVQLATSVDFETWTLTGNDAMGTLAPWANQTNPRVWAPDVYQREDGTFILYYSALTTTDPSGRLHCIGTATSDSIQGPYNSNSDVLFACPLELGGAIDPAAFRDDDGTRYVVYKIDGNALGHGGLCGNTVEPLVSTPIMIQEVDEDWTTPLGSPIQILDRGEYDGPLIEAPSMIKREGTYYLFFSSNCYFTTLYDTSYATSSSPTGPFVKTHWPLLVSETIPGTAGPGGASHADVEFDGVYMAFHAYASVKDVGGRRAMFVRALDVSSDLVALH